MAGLDVIDERQAHYDDEREAQQCADEGGDFPSDVHMSLFDFLTLLRSAERKQLVELRGCALIEALHTFRRTRRLEKSE